MVFRPGEPGDSVSPGGEDSKSRQQLNMYVCLVADAGKERKKVAGQRGSLHLAVCLSPDNRLCKWPRIVAGVRESTCRSQ